jgi:mitochondrial-processing peptidase subunit beta
VETNYTVDRMVVSVAGNVEHDAVVELVDGLFKGIRTSPTSVVPLTKSRFVGSDIRYRYDSIPNCNVAIAFEGLPWLHPDSVALMVMQSMIGSYNGELNAKFSSSSAVSQLAERGLAEKFMSFNTQYHDTGLFGAYLVADHHNIEDAMWVVMRAFVELAHNSTDETVEKAKNSLKTAILHGLETSAGVAEDVGRQLLVYGKRMSVV